MKQSTFNEINDVICDQADYPARKTKRWKITVVSKTGYRYVTSVYAWTQHQGYGSPTDWLCCEIKGGGQLNINVDDIESIIL